MADHDVAGNGGYPVENGNIFEVGKERFPREPKCFGQDRISLDAFDKDTAVQLPDPVPFTHADGFGEVKGLDRVWIGNNQLRP